MPIATSGIYEVSLRTRRSGQDLFNVFHYLAADGLNNHAADLASEFISEHAGWVEAVVSTAVTFVDVTVRPIFGSDLEHVETFPPGTAGDLVGEVTASFLTSRIRFNRETRETRSGWKRFGPLTEDAVAGDFVTANVLIALQASADALVDPLTLGVTNYTPVIFRAANTAIDPLPRYNNIVSATAFNNVTTQDTRKVS